MCRIAGILNEGLNIDSSEQMVRQMCQLLKHGGPDDEGIYSCVEANLVLGNRRLALLDLSDAGHQPMQYQNRYFITYNGELYNYILIKDELKKLGHHFITGTDTEVILAAFSQWNVQSFAKFNGMYAFALWDNVQKEIYLVRDAAGMKPLYYSTASDGLAFASEIRAFKAIPYLDKANNNWPVYLMAYGHIPEPVTTLADIRPLHKGCFFKYNVATGTHSLQSFAHYSFSNKINTNTEAELLIKNTLQKAVHRHLLADAPIGVFLSGGIDSGIIASLASQIKKDNLNSLSICFEDPQFSEKKFQDNLIQKLKCKNYQYLLKEDEFENSLPTILKNMDMPGCDGINTWFISKYAAEKGFKAVLSGVGGDELFGGYPSFQRASMTQMLQKFPAPLLNITKYSNKKQLARMAYLNMDGIKGAYLFLRGLFTPPEIARQLNATEKEVWNLLEDLPVISALNNLENKNKTAWMEFNLYMQNQLLRDADVMGMAHGVEIRVPFLDDEFIRLSMNINAAIKFKGPLPKQILINTFKNILPETIWNRPKMGFSFPFAKWLADSKYVKGLMEDGNKITKLNYKKFIAGNLHWSHLMSLILLRHRNHA